MRLMDYETGENIGEATAEQVRASIEAARTDGGAGIIAIDAEWRILREDEAGPDARRVYVEEEEPNTITHENIEDMITHENIEDMRLRLPCDQAAELVPGCETWRIELDGGEGGHITVWPNGRCAVMHGGDSEWGDRCGSRLVMDDGETVYGLSGADLSDIPSCVGEPDGWYEVYPEGGATVLVKLRENRVVDICEEAEWETHRTAGDKYARIIEQVSGTDEEASEHLPAVANAYARFMGEDVCNCHAQRLGGDE